MILFANVGKQNIGTVGKQSFLRVVFENTTPYGIFRKLLNTNFFEINYKRSQLGNFVEKLHFKTEKKQTGNF